MSCEQRLPKSSAQRRWPGKSPRQAALQHSAPWPFPPTQIQILKTAETREIRRDFHSENCPQAREGAYLEGHLVKELESHTCPICYELMVPPGHGPVLLFPCGHSFCSAVGHPGASLSPLFAQLHCSPQTLTSPNPPAPCEPRALHPSAAAVHQGAHAKARPHPVPVLPRPHQVPGCQHRPAAAHPELPVPKGPHPPAGRRSRLGRVGGTPQWSA